MANLNNIVWKNKTLPFGISPALIDKVLVPNDLFNVWAKLEQQYGLHRGILFSLCVWENRGFDRYVNASNGLGLFQFENVAVEQVRRDSGGIVYDRTKPLQASYMAAILLARYTRLFVALDLVVMAWNWGETNVRKWLRAKSNGESPKLNLVTAEYVVAVKGMLT
jgi:Transglycosylase SLT domain